MSDPVWAGQDRHAHVAALARPTLDINHVIAVGQSLAVGYEGWPALSLTQPHDSLMLGASVRPTHELATAWRPVGGAGFTPLVATVQAIGSGELLAPELVARLPKGDAAQGETILESAVNLWRGRMLAAGGAAARHRLLASTVGVGGQTLEALSRGATPPLFDRFASCASLAREVAARHGLSYGVVALLFLQGESNSFGVDGGTANGAAYRRLLGTLHRDLLAEAAGVSGQSAPPGLFTYQTGGAYANEGNSIAQAQLDYTLATPGCFMVGPSYPVTEKFGHLDANGYRWLGAQFGKVLHRVLDLGQDWRPLHPLGATLAGRVLTVAFHVPVPPLAWGVPFIGQRRAEPRDRGFRARDQAGEVELAEVTLQGSDTVRLLLARDATGPVSLFYADKLRAGRGALCDSDTAESPDFYVYASATGHDPDADHPDLNDRPYRLRNWCAAFAMPVVTLQAESSAGPVAVPPPPPPAVAHDRSAGAWEALRAGRTEITGERLPAPRGWLARLWRRLVGRD